MQSKSQTLMWGQLSARVSMESWYQHLLPILDLRTQIFSVPVSVFSLRLRFFQSQSWSHHWDSDIFSLGLCLVIETRIFPVLVLVLPLRLRHFQSRCHHWYSDIFSLRFGFVIETQTFAVSVLVSVLMIHIWSRWFLFLFDITLLLFMETEIFAAYAGARLFVFQTELWSYASHLSNELWTMIQHSSREIKQKLR